MQIETAITQVLAEDRIKKHITPDSVMCIALSAGVDSTVLLHALVRYFSQTNPQQKIKAIHVHHGLSDHADDWACQAEQLCQDLSTQFAVSIECCIEKIQLNAYSEGLEQAARQARYEVFEKHCEANDVLFQGHHLDDQIETFFMRAIRGSGLTGLSSIPQQRNLSRHNNSQIVRPFLSLEKSELLQYAQQQQLSWVEDESNQDSKIERNWWRNELLPQIWHYYNNAYGNKKKSLLRTINNVQQEQALLTHLMQKNISSNERFSDEGPLIDRVLARFPAIEISSLPAGFEISYLRAWLSQYVDLLPSSEQMHAICLSVIAADVDADPHFVWSNNSLRRYRGKLFLLPQSLSTKTIFSVQCEDKRHRIIAPESGVLVSRDCLVAKEYIQRCFLPGDQIKITKRPQRKLKKYWQELGVPSWLRAIWPILVDPDNGQVVLVFGLLAAEDIVYDEAIDTNSEAEAKNCAKQKNRIFYFYLKSDILLIEARNNKH